jgi:hypothetical protein
MPTEAHRRETRKSANFHDTSARELYARHFTPIGIAAVAAGAAQHRSVRRPPSPRDIPAILRGHDLD